MKKMIALFLTFMLGLSLAGCSGDSGKRLDNILESGKLVVATSPDYAPYEFIDPTKSGTDAVVGADIEFAKYIARELGVELVIEAMNFDASLAAVQEGKADLVISGLAHKPDRAEAMHLSEYYNMSSYQGMMVMKSDLEQYKTKEDFNGKVVGAQNASLQYDNVESQLPEAKLEVVTSISDGIMMLRAGRLDCFAISGVSGDQYASNYDDIAMSDFRFDMDNEGNVVGIKKGETALLDKINEIIETVNAENLYDIWLEEAIELSNALAE